MCSDTLFIGFIHRVLFRNMPRAAESLKHYCENGGQPLMVSAKALFTEDEGFASYASREMERGIQETARAGTIDVPQWALSNPDWRFALGSFQLSWCVAGDDVMARISGVYDWHPDESRITKPVHEAAARLKRSGASAYTYFSKPALFSSARIKKCASGTLISRDRVYM